MQVVSLKISQAPQTILALDSLIQLGPFAQWTMDCKLSALHQVDNLDKSDQESWSAMLDVGLSNNSVETHKLQMQAGKLVSSSLHSHSFAQTQLQKPMHACIRHALYHDTPLASAGGLWHEKMRVLRALSVVLHVPAAGK